MGPILHSHPQPQIARANPSGKINRQTLGSFRQHHISMPRRFTHHRHNRIQKTVRYRCMKQIPHRVSKIKSRLLASFRLIQPLRVQSRRKAPLITRRTLPAQPQGNRTGITILAARRNRRTSRHRIPCKPGPPLHLCIAHLLSSQHPPCLSFIRPAILPVF